MTKKAKVPQEFFAFLDEFGKESDRAAVILGAAQLDILLYQLIQAFLLPSPTSSDTLLDSDRSVGTFAARIDLSHRTGLVDAHFSHALHMIRKIRNTFAHETGSTTLELGSLRDKVRELVIPFRGYDIFDELCKNEAFQEQEETSRQFRTALAIVCLRLQGAITELKQVEAGHTMTLVPENWLEKTNEK